MVLGSPSFALDCQPYIKVNVPSYRFADMVIATAGSVTDRSRSLEHVMRCRGRAGRWGADLR